MNLERREEKHGVFVFDVRFAFIFSLWFCCSTKGIDENVPLIDDHYVVQSNERRLKCENFSDICFSIETVNERRNRRNHSANIGAVRKFRKFWRKTFFWKKYFVRSNFLRRVRLIEVFIKNLRFSLEKQHSEYWITVISALNKTQVVFKWTNFLFCFHETNKKNAEKRAAVPEFIENRSDDNFDIFLCWQKANQSIDEEHVEQF